MIRLEMWCMVLTLVPLLLDHFAEGGTCWSSISEDGRCKKMIQTLVTKKYCCELAGGSTVWTKEDYDAGQVFFWDAVGGGAPNCERCSESCEDKNCADDEICTVKNGVAKCGCNRHCPLPSNGTAHQPVCSVDGVTFKSECHLKKHNCRIRLRSWTDYQGHCQPSCETVKCKEDQQCVLDRDHVPHCVRCQTRCPDLYSPVCGTDGVTYDSMCHLHKAACEDKPKKIQYAYRGSCLPSATCLGTKCAAKEVCILDPQNSIPRCVRCDLTCARVADSAVCGTDGITYTNWCKLRQTSCTFRLLIQVDRLGPCEIQTKERI